MAFRAPWAKLARLRSEARSAERDWLRSALQDFKRDAVRELAQAAGLRVRADDNILCSFGSGVWLATRVLEFGA